VVVGRCTNNRNRNSRFGDGKEEVTKRKTRKAVVADLADGVAIAALDSGAVKDDNATVFDPEMRRQLVAAEAYFFAERRGFSGGNEIEDWVAAERVVDSWLTRSLNS
jgi:Protein of unknown function (DUF2934)